MMNWNDHGPGGPGSSLTASDQIIMGHCRARRRGARAGSRTAPRQEEGCGPIISGHHRHT
eukprot:729168-Hanusia_phi.AAC.1